MLAAILAGSAIAGCDDPRVLTLEGLPLDGAGLLMLAVEAEGAAPALFALDPLSPDSAAFSLGEAGQLRAATFRETATELGLALGPVRTTEGGRPLPAPLAVHLAAQPEGDDTAWRTTTALGAFADFRIPAAACPEITGREASLEVDAPLLSTAPHSEGVDTLLILEGGRILRLEQDLTVRELELINRGPRITTAHGTTVGAEDGSYGRLRVSLTATVARVDWLGHLPVERRVVSLGTYRSPLTVGDEVIHWWRPLAMADAGGEVWDESGTLGWAPVLRFPSGADVRLRVKVGGAAVAIHRAKRYAATIDFDLSTARRRVLTTTVSEHPLHALFDVSGGENLRVGVADARGRLFRESGADWTLWADSEVPRPSVMLGVGGEAWVFGEEGRVNRVDEGLVCAPRSVVSFDFVAASSLGGRPLAIGAPSGGRTRIFWADQRL